MRNNSVVVPVLAILVSSCGGGGGNNNPPADVPEDKGMVDIGAEVAAGNCECVEKIAKGACYRFTEMTCSPAFYSDPDMAKRAEAVCSLLNDIWKRDIGKHILNVMFKIDSYDGATKVMKLQAGSAWKYMSDGKPCETTKAKDCVGKFTLMADYATEFLFDMDKCDFKTKAASGYDLYFHTGDVSAPVLCCPELAKPNALPLAQLQAKGSFDSQCNLIVNASLQGCIATSSADKVCMCTDTKYMECAHAPNPTATNYCEKTCGIDFGQNFGGFVADVAQLAPTCKVGSEDGYALGGGFKAELLPADQCN